MQKKPLIRFQYHFMIKAPRRLGIEGMSFKIINVVYDKLTLNGEKLKPFPLKSRMR
jgi:hypothetical protein